MKEREDRQMGNYILKATLNPGVGNPEFEPDKKLQDGLEADGFALFAVENDRPKALIVHGMTTMDLASIMAGDKSECGSVVRQAMAIAEGIQKAERIHKEEKSARAAREIADMLRVK